MKVNILFAAISILLMNCSTRSYYADEAENPVFKPNSEFHLYEDLSSPKFSHLITKYHLDTIFQGEYFKNNIWIWGGKPLREIRKPLKKSLTGSFRKENINGYSGQLTLQMLPDLSIR
jgi:hypothetical protein